MIKSLSLFDDYEETSEADVTEETSKLLAKIQKPKKAPKLSTQPSKKSGKLLTEAIREITEEVYRVLGRRKEDLICIRDELEFHDYVDKIIEVGEVSLDTETNNTLNSFDCLLMGLCLHCKGQKGAYIPVHHVQVLDKEQVVKKTTIEWANTQPLLSNQISEDTIKYELQRMIDSGVKFIYHNSTFDVEVIYTTCGVLLPIYWDTQSGAQVLNENELKALKKQYQLHIDPEQEKYSIEHLFQGLPYAVFPPELFTLYAATDAIDTTELKEYQLQEFSKPENKEIFDLFMTIEIPVLPVIVDMELTGVEADLEYATKMSVEFHRRSDEIQKKIDSELNDLKPRIDEWRNTREANTPIIGKTGKAGKSKNQQLSDPIDLGSPTQLAILLYDILKVPVVDNKKPRTTDSAALEALAKDKHVEICKIMLEKREVDILINTFIDAIPTFVQKDGRVHARFNSTGTQTGRFSSSSPNLQQIPSHEKSIRLIFKATDGYSIVGGDYSGQEPRSLCSFAKDLDMQDAYANKKDLYAVIASKCFHNDYWQNIEFEPIYHDVEPYDTELTVSGSKVKLYTTDKVYLDDTRIDSVKLDGHPGIDRIYNDGRYVTVYFNNYSGQLKINRCSNVELVQNQDNKSRRSKAKTVFLGILYGMGANTLAERMELPLKEAEQIIKDFYDGFPGIKKFTDESQDMASKLGYVTDIYGRRRHLPDALLPEYSFKVISGDDREFNPLLNTVVRESTKSKALISKYQRALSAAKWKSEKTKIIEDAKKNGLEVTNNSGFISRAKRQTLNARIQGSAASMTKLAMIMIHNDEELNRLGFKLLVPVHDEVFGECPRENSEACGKRLCEVMVEAANIKCSFTNWSVDPYMVSRWYSDELYSLIKGDYDKAVKKVGEEQAFKGILDRFSSYIQEKYLREMCDGVYNVNAHSDI